MPDRNILLVCRSDFHLDFSFEVCDLSTCIRVRKLYVSGTAISLPESEKQKKKCFSFLSEISCFGENVSS